MNYSQAKEILAKQEAAKATLNQYEKLANAHEKYGFKNRGEFIQALEDLDGRRGGRKPGVRRAAKGRAGAARRGRGLTEETVERIKSMKAEGKSNAEISRTVGASPITVAKYAGSAKGRGRGARTAKAGKRPAAKRRAGAGRGRGLPPAKVKRIQGMKAEGKSNAEISRSTGVSPLTVAKYVKAQGSGPAATAESPAQ